MLQGSFQDHGDCLYYSVEPVMASTDQTGYSDEFDYSLGSTNSSEFASSPKPKSPEGSTINPESEPSDQIIIDVPFATIATSPQPSTSQPDQSFSRGKDLSLLLKPGDKYQHLKNHFILGKTWATVK